MILDVPFEDVINMLMKTCVHGSYEYSDRSQNFTTCTTSHFKEIKATEKYGIYIIRQQETREVLYIGKAGTLNSQGQFKGQNVPGRLKNVKEGNILANKWFLNLLNEKGALIIEYIFLSISKSPAFIEAILLQAYLNEHQHLPFKNKQL